MRRIERLGYRVALELVAIQLEGVMHFRLGDTTLAVWNTHHLPVRAVIGRAKPIPVMSVMRNGLLWPPM